MHKFGGGNINTRLKNVLSLVEETYKQEQERLKALNQKADNLTRYVSIFLVLLNIIVPMVVKYTNINFKFAFCAYIFVCFPSILSLVFAVKEQKLSKICRFPTGHKLLDMTKDKVNTDDDWLKFKIAQYDKAIDVLEENNDSKVSDIRKGYNCYIFAIIMLTIFTLIIIVLGYSK